MKTTYFWTAMAAVCISLSACEQDLIPQPNLTPTDTYTNHPNHVRYQQYLDDYVQFNRLPGAVLLLKKSNESVWAGAAGFSNLEHQTPVKTTTPFRAGSISKTFVATLIMLLKEQGKLGLDDKLVDLLPKVKGKIPQSDQISLRHLLSHTSGIFDPVNEDTYYQLNMVNNPAQRASMSADDILQRYVYGRALAFNPGERYSYSNTNYLLLGQIIEKTEGKTLQTVLDERINQPLGLKSTYIDKRVDNNVARGYADFYANNQLMDVTALDRADGDGAYGGLVSTATDLFRFSEALFGGKLVSAATLKEMMTPFPVRQGESIYGLGIDQWPSTVLGTGYGHNGSLIGAEANVFYFPDQQATFVILTNYGSGSRKDFLEEVLVNR
ncbi:serine hydrolase domain-containing protein [Telluribacter humicola]|uniref:serine hydrolase domain-containing protein n=1 Tax=Telluribacter humicola TaxID=1720261 RepID=UPI001A97A42C|nr:serine hydrolase domain-containing protein [Telluribacter humicola]